VGIIEWLSIILSLFVSSARSRFEEGLENSGGLKAIVFFLYASSYSSQRIFKKLNER